MEKIKGYGLPFPAEYSSCSNLPTKTFIWTDGDRGGDGSIEMYIDRSIINKGKTTPNHPKKFGWFCESRYICKDVYDQLMADPGYYKSIYQKIFTCDSDLINLDPLFFIYSPPGSNLPWTKQEEMKMYTKTKLCSMIASPKASTYGHIKRLDVALSIKDKIDLFGGAHGSPRAGSGHGPEGSWWRSKLPALEDYMFQVVFENAEYDKYYTEKITDCFATGTIPVYWGTRKVCDDFNDMGIIFYDELDNIEQLSKELYNSLIPYAMDNLERVKNLTSADDQIYKIITSY